MIATIAPALPTGTQGGGQGSRGRTWMSAPGLFFAARLPRQDDHRGKWLRRFIEQEVLGNSLPAQPCSELMCSDLCLCEIYP